jgi:probable HAF family extracellular repeat protein
MLRQSQNFWIPWVTTIVPAGFSDAVAQAGYKVTDLGTEGNDNLACAMALNNEGWTEIMAGSVEPRQLDFVPATLLNGRAVLGIDGFKIDLGTRGGKNSWMMWGDINDFGQVVGFSETDVPGPDGEDICLFGTHLTCRPFLWQFFHMSALPTLGGNNGQASAINDRGQIVGFAENGEVDSTCPSGTTNNRIALPVLWENGTAFPLPDLGHGATAYGINNQGQIVGSVGSTDGSTAYGALWQNGALTNLKTLLGDSGAIATGINSKGQVVGSTWDSNFDWSHAFIYQNGVMTDPTTLFPASSNLFATMANKINENGQVSGLATVRSGPHAGDIHAFLATPVNQSIGTSVGDVARTHPKSNLPANVRKQLLQRFRLGRAEQ